MSKHPLDDFPSSAPAMGTNRASCGGDMTGTVKPLPYSPPVGPKNQNMQGPGLRGGTNHGKCGTQGRR